MPNKTVPGGACVVFDGLDGVGKTTQIKLVQAALESQGYYVYLAKGLGGTPIGEELRAVLFKQIYRPALTNFYIGVAAQIAAAEAAAKERAKGAIVLIDRGPISMVAYQSFGDGVNPELAWRYADDSMVTYAVDLTIVYNLTLEEAKHRLKTGRSGKTDYFERQPQDYFKRVEAAIKLGAKRYQASVIDAQPSIEQVHSRTMAQINQLVAKKTKA